MAKFAFEAKEPAHCPEEKRVGEENSFFVIFIEIHEFCESLTIGICFQDEFKLMETLLDLYGEANRYSFFLHELGCVVCSIYSFHPCYTLFILSTINTQNIYNTFCVHLLPAKQGSNKNGEIFV